MRANDQTHKIFFKGQSEDFIVFVDDLEILKKWKGDRSIPLTDVLNGWKIFVTHGLVSLTLTFQTETLDITHGAQGVLDTASKTALENEFGTSKEEECIVKILENGDYQTTTTRERDGSKNDSKGSVAIGR
ncbi:hypothetical protein N7539_006448 [Penicillium diatomitis]|uniref:Ribosome maturation protein SDO1/SBDS N-terminal domain-containing protein n=1 Tax=Penicillium diatomitis TaxID=2819901 RepID=A0A9W9X354_9EURO|nr:uncharacterized protein N7539_006448 [Penicillium diatomitis]KAJ5483002.1 hypothetical protein N7539_006448 [Penicillium diatomitis]